MGPRLVKIKNLLSDKRPTLGFVNRSPNLIPFFTGGNFLLNFDMVDLSSFYSNILYNNINIPMLENTCNNIKITKNLDEMGFFTDN